ncbi:Mak10 subunit, NatC N-terminal acetyltransferase-domain-containing protein [Mycotypha africana]|uniref:Mak10 subunit, NatC N-terminal acetyltransferase-domain-containing protein n=1 Tax=Mycotypha africana TaxID=64632 RepID=UPI002300E50E|nr:Mak10 subunit, NatC N-terminal acetyltransferase-domain-containing protein [Mycotypha africana]KAI8979809.1 Mak10 subunit, NatC N-terminal acetyltransferase-domain-containing protein [Mycotypha africana]
MGAIVVMDPRMDTGMNVNNNNDEQQSFDIDKRLSGKQTLNIMDQLVVREMAWISGHSLSQTVFTCIYFHHVQKLSQLPMPTLSNSSAEDTIYGVLKAYILATLKCCHYIFMEMSQGNVYEEEDFTTNLFGLSLNDQQRSVTIFNDLDFSLQLLNHRLSHCGDITEEDRQIFIALQKRVELRKSFLLSLVHLSQYSLSEAKKELEKMMIILDNLDLSLGEDYPYAFDANINRKLTSQTPPRPVELVSVEQSYKEFKAMIERLISICDVTEFSSVTSLMNYFIAFGSRRPYPDAFSRSKLNVNMVYISRQS